MGMFDNIRCDLPMPDDGLGDDGFQTKDLDCELNSFVITTEGRLVKLAENDRDATHGTDMNYEGRLVFYGGTGGREFVAQFKKGRLTLLALPDDLDR